MHRESPYQTARRLNFAMIGNFSRTSVPNKILNKYKLGHEKNTNQVRLTVSNKKPLTVRYNKENVKELSQNSKVPTLF